MTEGTPSRSAMGRKARDARSTICATDANRREGERGSNKTNSCREPAARLHTTSRCLLPWEARHCPTQRGVTVTRTHKHIWGAFQETTLDLLAPLLRGVAGRDSTRVAGTLP
jgi:hypothetical protein